MIWKVALALAGCVAVGVIMETVVGGALGWMLSGAVLAATCFRLFKTLFERRGMRFGRWRPRIGRLSCRAWRTGRSAVTVPA